MNSEVCEAIANDLDEVSQKISDYVTYVAEHGAPAPALEPACSSEIFELEKNIRQKVLFGGRDTGRRCCRIYAGRKQDPC